MKSLIITAFLLLTLFSCGEKQKEMITPVRPVKYAHITSSSGMESHVFSGVAKAKNETKLSFKVAGSVSSVLVNLGDKVTKGQLIATINSSDYTIQSNQALSQKEGFLANKQSAEANAKAAETQLINAQSTYDRVVKLYESNSVSLSEYQKAKAGIDAAKSQFEAATSQVNAANQQVNSANQQVEAATNQVNYTRLTSPMDGIITAVQVESNEIVNAGMPIVVISSLGRPEVEVGVPEVFINQVKIAQRVIISLSSAPGEQFNGMVNQVAFASGKAPTYPVIVQIDSLVTKIRPGMAANVEFRFPKEGKSKDNRLIVPVEAVGKDGESNFVFLLRPTNDGTFLVKKTAIKIGDLRNDGFELLEGLQEDERVATAGLQSLMDGMTVKLMDK